MLVLSKGQTADFKFVFTDYNGSIYDPGNIATPVDVVVYILRGDTGAGPVIDGPYSLLKQNANVNDNKIVRTGTGEYVFTYKVPNNLYEYTYTIVASTVSETQNINATVTFQVKADASLVSPVTIVSPKSSVINYRPTYQQLNRKNTSTILLIGHANNLNLNHPVKINSIQHAVDLLGADTSSPLLRGVFDAYSCGARDIIICASAPMSEYVEAYSNRNIQSEVYSINDATPSSKTFYERYYERLSTTYSNIIDLDFVDIIVPLETSIMNTGSVDFVTQLAEYCSDFHNNTGFVQMGIIGSRSDGVKASDIDVLEQKTIFTNKFTVINSSTGQIVSDIGRYVVPIYGELVFQHPQIKISYTSTAAAAVAGMIAANQEARGLIRSRIPGAMSMFGNDLTYAHYERLESLGINTIYRGRKTRRAVPFEIYLTNEYTMAHTESVFKKLFQMRLVAAVVSEVKAIALSRFDILSYDSIIDEVKSYLNTLKKSGNVLDFSVKARFSDTVKGVLIFDIELISYFAIKKINFSLAAGPGA